MNFNSLDQDTTTVGIVTTLAATASKIAGTPINQDEVVPSLSIHQMMENNTLRKIMTDRLNFPSSKLISQYSKDDVDRG